MAKVVDCGYKVSEFEPYRAITFTLGLLVL